MGNNVYRMTPEQLIAYNSRLARMRNGGAKVCPSCNTPADMPHPAECAYKPAGDESGASAGAGFVVDSIGPSGHVEPSPNFVHYFGEAKAVVAEYMNRPDRARSFALRLTVPQSVNSNTLPTAQGGRVLTDEHRAWRSAVAFAVYQAKAPKLTGRLTVFIRVNAPRIDIDNIVKPTLDALQRAGAIDNDRNVDDLHVVRAPAIPDGMLDVEVGEM